MLSLTQRLKQKLSSSWYRGMMDNIINVTNKNQVGGALILFILLYHSHYDNECNDDERNMVCSCPECGKNGPI